MTMNKILLVLIVASGFLLIFYANNDIFTRKRWAKMFQQQQQEEVADGDAGGSDGSHHISGQHQQHHHHQKLTQLETVHFAGGVEVAEAQEALSLSQLQQRSGGGGHRRHVAPLSYDDWQPVRYAPSANRSAEHNIFVIFTKENYMLRTKFELFMKSLLKYASVPLHLHLISDAHSQPVAVDIVRKQMQFYARQKVARLGAVQYSVYNVTEAAQRIGDVTQAMMPHFSVPGSQYADALFYVSLGLHRIVDAGMRRGILIDCDVVFRSDVGRLFEEFNRFAPDNLFGLSPELTPVYYHVLYKYRARNPSTNFGRPYYPAGSVEPRPALHERKHSANGLSGSAKQGSVKHGYPGLNSGVVMLDFDRIRRSRLFEDALQPEHVERLVRKYHFKGHLGDQDYYSLLGFEYPGLIYRLDCVWNRQLCTWWKDHGYSEIFDTFFHCEGKIRLYHGNCNTRVPE